MNILNEVLMVICTSLQLGSRLFLQTEGFLLKRKLRGVIARTVEIICAFASCRLVLVGLVAVGIVVTHEYTCLCGIIEGGGILAFGPLSHHGVRVCRASHFLQNLCLIELTLEMLRILERGRSTRICSCAASVSLRNLVELADVGDSVVSAQLGACDIRSAGARGHPKVRESTYRGRLLVDIHRRVLVKLLGLVGL